MQPPSALRSRIASLRTTLPADPLPGTSTTYRTCRLPGHSSASRAACKPRLAMPVMWFFQAGGGGGGFGTATGGRFEKPAFPPSSSSTPPQSKTTSAAEAAER